MKNCRPLDKKGFTLIEVVVVMAIIATLTGIMIPFIYKVWESTEIDTTRERMTDLKKAMVGDPRLIQNGVRTNFGFVGDNGQLPEAISNPDFGGQYTVSDDLVTGSYLYMPAGYDPAKYKKDAWGRNIVYTVTTSGSRRVAAALVSAGPDGALGTSDDIADSELQITEREVTPTNVVQGNAFFNFYNSQALSWDPALNAFYAKISIAYNPSLLQTCCVSLGDIASIPPGGSAQVPLYIKSDNCSFTYKFPVGKIIAQAGLYINADCSTLADINSLTAPTAVFVSDGVNAISVNLPTIHYTH
jgi:prepilin-type N-terminal cleavage/methylation domain-containing protein